jgi:signal transduction histidine kinase
MVGMPRELSARIFANTPARFAIALLSTALALLVASGLNPTVNVPVAYLTALAAVAFSSRYCGTWPSIASVALSLFGIDFWFLAPTHSLRITLMSDWLNLCVFLLPATVVVAIGEADRRQRIRLRNAAGELEEKVQVRTAELDHTNQSLRELTGRLMNLQDEERRRIARELHDNAGQALAALAMNLDTVANDLQQLMKTANTVADSASLVQQMSTDIRTMSYLLHPPLLDDAGLVAALQWFIHGFSERSKIAVELKCDESLGGLPKEVEIATFRLVQECLTNIHRHSGSTTASIRITQQHGQLSVDVRDLGKGISSQTREQMESGGAPGVGIRGMRERVRQLGGKLEVSSDGIGMGTRIVARLPVTEVIPIPQVG